jgi:hypothetical protein
MDLIKNRETGDGAIANRLAAETVESAVITEIRRVLRTPETAAQVMATLTREGHGDVTEAEAVAALQGFDELWAQLFPGEQARIVALLVQRVTVAAEGLVIDLRTDSIAGVMRELMTPKPMEAA